MCIKHIGAVDRYKSENLYHYLQRFIHISEDMCDSFIGCVVSIDCGDVLGTYQGQVVEIEKQDNTLTIVKCFRNGIQCQVPKVTLWLVSLCKFLLVFLASKISVL